MDTMVPFYNPLTCHLNFDNFVGFVMKLKRLILLSKPFTRQGIIHFSLTYDSLRKGKIK